jgi:hypothetical protein
MTDIQTLAKELEQIKSIMNVMYSKLECVERQTSYCVNALIELTDNSSGYGDEPLSQHDIDEFDDDDDDVAPPSYASSSSSTTNIVQSVKST